MRLYGVVGWKNAGKTGLMERLVIEITARGISVSTVLRNQAEDMRITRKQIAQTKAMKAPVKMLIPMVFCIFPPMFIVVIGPAALNMTSSGGFG